MTILPEIKMNIVMSNENQKFKNNDSDDSDNEIHVKFLKLIPQKRNLVTFLKLPPVKQTIDNNLIKNVSKIMKFFLLE